MQIPASTQALETLRKELEREHREVQTEEQNLQKKDDEIAKKKQELARLETDANNTKMHIEELRRREMNNQRQITDMQAELKKLIEKKK